MTERLSRIPPESIVGTILRLPLRLLPRNAVVTVRSGINRGMKWIIGSSIHGCWLGHYEQEKQEIVRQLVKPGMNVFDIGANAGFYTLAFSRLVGPTGHVWAFEPFAENVRNLLLHVRLNGLANVTVVQAAASDRIGLAGFRVAESNSMGSLSSEQKEYLVPTVALDELLKSGTVPLPDLVKMDVEGGESRVLRGARTMLARGGTGWLVALHGKDAQRESLAELAAADYTVTTLGGGAVNPELLFDEIMAMPRNMGSRFGAMGRGSQLPSNG